MSSIHDVAKQAGVSIATVSRTFSTPDLINEQTQQRVLAVARQLNYKPRRQRTSVARDNAFADAIGFQFFSAEPEDTLGSNTFYAPVLAGAQTEASLLGLHLLLHTTDRHSLSLELPRMILEQTVGGMLLVGTADPEILATFAKHVPRIVLVDNRDQADACESIVSDGFGGTYAATRHLLNLGHRQIGFFLDEGDVLTFQDRLHGYYGALLDAGVTPEREWVVRGSALENSESQLVSLLAQERRPTALLASNDHHAFDILCVCRELGLDVPNDVSVVGFDDISFSTQTSPPLTTVRVDKEFMGRLAVRRLHAQLQAEHVSGANDPPICNVVPVSLIVRQSTCPPPPTVTPGQFHPRRS